MTESGNHVAVIGPGAIGIAVAVHLSRSSAAMQVTLIDYRPDRAARLAGRPLRLHTAQGVIEAAVAVRTTPATPPDLVVLATKAYAARAAAEAAAAWIGAAPIITLQNGLGVTDEVRAALPQTTVITGVLYQGANVAGEGEVHHVANLATHLGYEGRPPDAAIEAAAALFAAAGLHAIVQADMRPVVWGKLLVNAAINPTAGLAGVTNGEVATRPTLRAMAQAIAEEGEAAARAEGVTLPYASALEATLDTARRTADNRCSMLQDLEAGRPTEIEYLNGAVARVAEVHGLPAPANRAAAALVKQLAPREYTGGRA